MEKISFVTDHIKKEGAVESQATSGRESLNSNLLEPLKKQPQLVLKVSQNVINMPHSKKRDRKRGEKENNGVDLPTTSTTDAVVKRKKLS